MSCQDDKFGTPENQLLSFGGGNCAADSSVDLYFDGAYFHNLTRHKTYFENLHTGNIPLILITTSKKFFPRRYYSYQAFSWVLTIEAPLMWKSVQSWTVAAITKRAGGGYYYTCTVFTLKTKSTSESYFGSLLWSFYRITLVSQT